MRKFVMIIGVMMLAVLLVGCSSGPKVAEIVPEAEGQNLAEQVILYAYDTEEEKSYNTVCELPVGQGISVENVVSAYQTQVMSGVYGQSLGINSTKVENGNLYIDFNAQDIGKLSLGSGSEGNFFGDLARTIEANLPTIEHIYYTMDDGDLVTGHLMFSKDEPFWYGQDAPQE